MVYHRQGCRETAGITTLAALLILRFTWGMGEGREGEGGTCMVRRTWVVLSPPISPLMACTAHLPHSPWGETGMGVRLPQVRLRT